MAHVERVEDARPAVERAEQGWAEFYGPNAGYVVELFERFTRDPSAVDERTRAFFQRWRPPETLAVPERVTAASARPATSVETEADSVAMELVAAAGRLATGIREYGHRAARLDPLGSEPPGDPELDPATHGLDDADLDRLPASAVGGPPAAGAANAREAIDALRRIYCGTVGYDYDHVQDATERVWLRDAAESGPFRPPKDPINERALLERLSEVGAFERFLHRTFPGQTRFSIEGTGMLIPMLDEIIGAAAETGTRSLLLGMAHRGRLNVLAHVLRKPHVEILAEFKAPSPRAGISWSGSSGEAFSGDVKYHLGARRAVINGEQVQMAVTLVPNPSHLEYVNPVVEGMARAADERRDRPGPPVQDETASLPVLIHGDASFPGQGVVAETLNLSRLPGYRTGGTIHLIVNNQLGFTVEPGDARSTLYASDLAKGFEIPIVHVNADDPEACIAAARLAHAYRERFHKDFLVDLIGYRRWGHNEGDDPSFTQPEMYARIADHPTVRELWAAELRRRGVATDQEAAALLAARTAELQEAMAEVNRALENAAVTPHPPAPSPLVGEGEPRTASLPLGPPSPLVGEPGARDAGGGVRGTPPTGVPLEQLQAFNNALYRFPEGFALHPRLERPTKRRREAFATRDGQDAATIDWGQAETLAFAAILADGVPIRLTGQDTARGTFSQRHAVLRDYKTGEPYTPLHQVPGARASFEVRDSPLSESAAVGFEYGYCLQAPDTLVLWEAQYGDFVNSAQVMIDQFLVSARTKWDQRPSLVLLLPHAYEGQGPEHSSARLERFLELAAEDNVRIANCTTAGQYFHLLRRQAALLRSAPRPLIVMTPKSLLRHPMAASPPAALAAGTAFQPVLDDPFFAPTEPAARTHARRAILCTGKVYVDLASSPARASAHEVAVIRLEQLYPFPSRALRHALGSYPDLRDIVWLQEEPRNMGAWTFVEPRLRHTIEERGLAVRYVGRPERASPSEGTPARHAAEQSRIVAEAFEGLSPEPPQPQEPQGAEEADRRSATATAAVSRVSS